MDLMQPCQATCIPAVEEVQVFLPAFFYDLLYKPQLNNYRMKNE
jgi:hypothetical protein